MIGNKAVGYNTCPDDDIHLEYYSGKGVYYYI
jgi:hypothetical protein